jgi:TPR repeat protein
MTFFDILKNLKKTGWDDRRKPQPAVSFRLDGEDDLGWTGEVLDGIVIKDDAPAAPLPELVIKPQEAEEIGPELEPLFEEEAAVKSEALADDPPAGGIYAVQERNGGLYRLVKVVHSEGGLVHVVRYAGRFTEVPAALAEEKLTLGAEPADGSFGAEHLPLAGRFFSANSIHIQDSTLNGQDVRGYKLYVDSVFDCLGADAPQWLRKAGSYAAWRSDRNAMAALADRYLIGVDVPMDSKKALYWLNRIVQQGIGIVQPGGTVSAEHQILTGGLYACAMEDGSWTILKVLLKDKHGVQQISFPAALPRLPQRLNPVRIAEQAAQPGAVFHHTALSAAEFLQHELIFIGLLPIRFEEVHPYRSYLRKVFADAEFRPSTFQLLLRRAEAGELEAQHETAQIYLSGDLEWEVEQNIPEAVRWLTEAANLGYGPAAHSLALVCRSGAGSHVAPDAQLSFEWLLYAAQLDCGPAQLEAAECCVNGQGCAQDPALAHAWYSAAAVRDNGLDEAEKHLARTRRQQIDADLPAAQKARAREYFRQIQEAF